MNTYSTKFVCNDPLSGHPVHYTFKVKTPPQVVVDFADLVAIGLTVAKKPRRQEDLADLLRSMFPGKQTLTAHLFGVSVKTQREGRA